MCELQKLSVELQLSGWAWGSPSGAGSPSVAITSAPICTRPAGIVAFGAISQAARHTAPFQLWDAIVLFGKAGGLIYSAGISPFRVFNQAMIEFTWVSARFLPS